MALLPDSLEHVEQLQLRMMHPCNGDKLKRRNNASFTRFWARGLVGPRIATQVRQPPKRGLEPRCYTHTTPAVSLALDAWSWPIGECSPDARGTSPQRLEHLLDELITK